MNTIILPLFRVGVVEFDLSESIGHGYPVPVIGGDHDAPILAYVDPAIMEVLMAD